MHLLIELCRNMRVGVWVSLERGGLGWDRQPQGLSLSLSLRLSLILDLNLRHGRLERGYDLKRLTRKSFRSF